MARTLTVISLAFIVLSLACVFSSTTAPAPTIPAEPVITTAPTATPTYQSRPKGVAKNITYCTINDTSLVMDIYYPDPAPEPWPVVMYVHGGAWQTGDKNEGAGFQDVADLQKNGFMVVSINYRLAPKFKFPAQIQDVKCAVRYLRAHAGQYNLNPNKIGAWGGSAGGHLVSLLGTANPQKDWEIGEYPEQSSQVQAVVDMFGPADLTIPFPGAEQQLQKDVFNVYKPDDPILKTASPINYVSANDPPFLILHGDKDDLVPLQQSQVLYEKLKSAGVSVELVVVKNAGHSFRQVGDQPISPSRAELGKRIMTFFTKLLK
jgi:acetyl esterase/lipase